MLSTMLLSQTGLDSAMAHMHVCGEGLRQLGFGHLYIAIRFPPTFR